MQRLVKKDIVNFVRCDTFARKAYGQHQHHAAKNHFVGLVKRVARRYFSRVNDLQNQLLGIEQFQKLPAGVYANVLLSISTDHTELLIGFDFLEVVGIDDDRQFVVYEVKIVSRISQAIIKEFIIIDILLKKFCNIGAKFCLLYINKYYHSENDFQPQDYFLTDWVNISDYAYKAQKTALVVERFLHEFRLDSETKRSQPFQACFLPVKCHFFNQCFGNIEDTHFYNLNSVEFDVKKQFEKKAPQVPITTAQARRWHLNPRGKMAINSLYEKTRAVDEKAIAKFLNQLKFPVSFLDFESIMPLLPFFQKFTPFQSLVVQFSLHTAQDDSFTLQHHDHIMSLVVNDQGGVNYQDEQQYFSEFFSQLQRAFPPQGSIVVYDRSNEAQTLRKIAEFLPQFRAEIEAILERFVDLLEVFKKYYFYDYRQMGSCSLKKIAPLFNDNTNYTQMQISNGADAVSMFYELFSPHIETNEREEKVRQILNYCYTDTLSMVNIVEGLNKLIKG